MDAPLPQKTEDPGQAVRNDNLWSQLPPSRKGYDRAATEALLTELVAKHAKLGLECGELRARAAELEAEVARHRRREQLVTRTLMEATDHAMTIRAKAREEAELLLRKVRAEQKRRTAQAERIDRGQEDAEQEIARLRGLAQEMQEGLRSFLSQTLEQLGTKMETGPEDGPPAADEVPALVDALRGALSQGGDRLDRSLTEVMRPPANT